MKSFIFVLLLCLSWATASFAGTVTYIYTDPQGTPLAETDAHGNITARFDYRPYGLQVLGNAPNGPGYTGHVNDLDVGLVYMQQRYYDPETQRFLSTDPKLPAAGDLYNLNRFQYGSNNPVRNIDPDGRQSEEELNRGRMTAGGGPITEAVNESIGVGLVQQIRSINPSYQLPSTVGPVGEPYYTEAVNNVLENDLAELRRSQSPLESSTGIRQNAAQGKAGEALTRLKYGDQIIGEQVTFKTSDGSRTRIDFVTGDLDFIETKTGGARLSNGQKKLFNDVESGREVIPVGRRATDAGFKAGRPTVLRSCSIDRC